MVKSSFTARLLARIGKDPDGVIDNRPGIAHPNRPKIMTRASSILHRKRDDFARNREFGAEVVNQTSKSLGSRNAKPEQPIGLGIGTRNPQKVDSRKKQKLSKKLLYRVQPKYFYDDEEEDTIVC